MTFEKRTLGELLSDPKIEPVARFAIKARDLSREDVWQMTPAELREKHIFTGDIGRGLQRLYAAADTKEWVYPLYSSRECAEDETLGDVNLVWLPSEKPEADERPYILLVPGGGFVNVWNLTEGWPVAEQFNRLGYHVFVLTYQVEDKPKLLEKDLEDFARALRLIQDHAQKFHVQGGRYITCGFSAGGYLVCLWNTAMGYVCHGLPKPEACFPIYPVVSLKLSIGDEETDPEDALSLYGCSLEEAMKRDYEIPEHAEGFPPTALFLAGDDGLVSPENSRMLAGALEALHIPCRLEIGPEGGHGFADGTGMCMAGWTERAVRWFESLKQA